MSAKQKQTSLGRSIIKNHSKKKRFVTKEGHRHSSDLPDGRDWGRLNLHSVTEHTTLDDFLDRVQLADKEYSAEFHNVKIVSQDIANGILSADEKSSIFEAQEKHKKFLRIPRRPQWDQTTTKEELDRNENEAFLDWRRSLALLNEEQHINLTPYEKNLEVWRQLWRVIEKSDVIVQIIDSRNPLLFRCEDLEVYVKEISEKKVNILLLNKADFLTLKQRQLWAQYFSSIGVKVVFFSALQQMQKTETDEEKEIQDPMEKEPSIEEMGLSDDGEQAVNICSSGVVNDTRLLSREELILFLKKTGQKHQSNPMTTIGLVGYPNVGKSSTINAVLSSKRVSVSATPGKTKHFQTLMIDSELCFCDCPGLVFPYFVSTKAEMVINGILPIDQLTSHIPPVTLVANLIPRRVLESTYSIILPVPGEGEDPTRPPTAEELLNAHGYMRGFMTHRGLPDTARSARYILKDYVNGKLLYCHAPPGIKQEDYQEISLINVKKSKAPDQSISDTNESNCVGDSFDDKFFQEEGQKNKGQEATKLHGSSEAHTKNAEHAQRMINGDKSLRNVRKSDDKKHHNRNRKQKLRRVCT